LQFVCVSGLEVSQGKLLVVSSGCRNTDLLDQEWALVERLGWCSPSECLSRSGVECVGHRLEIFGTVSAEIRALGEVSTDSSWCSSWFRAAMVIVGRKSRLRLWSSLWGKSRWRHWAICSGLHDITQRRSWRRPMKRVLGR